ncbi:MAG: site-2 protease family protein, partial [Oscillospiraceae bacterium]|nr:site-2 protease family protein [Oscillospiraceae bacterium]
FFDEQGMVAALAPAAAVHELGHALALALFHVPVTRLSLGMFGLRMDYRTALTDGESAICAAAGPAAGALWALAAWEIGGAFFRLSAILSLGLTLFNLLPVFPLDGGRILEALAGRKWAGRISWVVAATAALCGAALLGRFGLMAPPAMGLWLLFCQWRRVGARLTDVVS